MSLDPRSRERLEALGRSLPQPLPTPEPRRQKPASEARHPVEREQNPEQLFRELMTASKDGHVPPHLLERLRQLEQARSPRRPSTPAASPGSGRSSKPALPADQDLYEAFEDLLSLAAEDERSEQAASPRRDRGLQRPASHHSRTA
jgi:hypothetical protein